MAAAPTATTVPNLAAIRAAVDAAAFHAAGVKAADEKVFYDYQSVWSRSSRWGCEVGRRRRLRLRRRRRATDVHVGEVGNRQGCEGTREPGLGEVGSWVGNREVIFLLSQKHPTGPAISGRPAADGR